jgi:hypothetical protein
MTGRDFKYFVLDMLSSYHIFKNPISGTIPDKDGYHNYTRLQSITVDYISTCVISLSYFKDDINVLFSCRESPYTSLTNYSKLLSELKTSDVIKYLDNGFRKYPLVVLNDKNFSDYEKSMWKEQLDTYDKWRKNKVREINLEALFDGIK